MGRKRKKAKPTTIGWKEYVYLPQWNIKRLKAKMDTGARTSAIHASKVQKLSARKLVLLLHPHRKKSDKTYRVVAPITQYKWVTDSGGHREKRPVVKTSVVIGKKKKRIELTVTNRDNMLFRLILGRKALEKDFVVDPSRKYLVSKPRVKGQGARVKR